MTQHGAIRWECERTPLTTKNKRIYETDGGLDRLEQATAHFPNKGLALAYAKRHCKADCFGVVMIYKQTYNENYYESGVGGWETERTTEVSLNSATSVPDVYDLDA